MMLFEEKPQPQQEVHDSQVVPKEEEVYGEWERVREEIAREVDAKLQLARRVVETERALELVRSPKDTIRLAKEAAEQLMDIVKHRPDWVVSIEGREFLAFPAWQLCGTFFGLYPAVVETRELRDADGRVIGFHAVAVVKNRFGDEITRAEARADRNELMPEYEKIKTPDGKWKRRRPLMVGSELMSAQLASSRQKTDTVTLSPIFFTSICLISDILVVTSVSQLFGREKAALPPSLRSSQVR